MNKQELIERIEGLKNIFGNKVEYIEIDAAIELVSKLDEPQKVTIPQFVADVIEDAREKSPELEDALHYTWGNGTKEFTEWYNKKSNRDLFARAWLDGYEVEEEKRYLVTLKNRQPLVKSQSGSTLYFSQDITARNYKGTQKELEEAGFGWVFDCPGIDVEEVE